VFVVNIRIRLLGPNTLGAWDPLHFYYQYKCNANFNVGGADSTEGIIQRFTSHEVMPTYWFSRARAAWKVQTENNFLMGSSGLFGSSKAFQSLACHGSHMQTSDL
jgi:hypothetical protein